MKISTRSPWLLAPLLGAWSQHAAAQCGPCGIPILELTAGARPLGLGGAYVTGNGPNAVFHNPAQAGSVHGSIANVERIGDATLGAFATTGSVGPFGVGAGVRILAGGLTGPFEDSTHLPGGAFVATAAVARMVGGAWIGGSASYVTPELAGGGGAAFDVGAAARWFGLLIGVSVQNLGRDFKVGGNTQELPRRVAVGISSPGAPIGTYFDLSASVEVSRERGGAVIPKGGVELSYEPVSGWTLTARAGVRRIVARAGQFRQSSVTFGGSFELDRVAIDYAFLPAVSGGSPAHSFALRIQ